MIYNKVSYLYQKLDVEAAGSGNFHVEIHTVQYCMCVRIDVFNSCTIVPWYACKTDIARTYVQVPYPV